MSDLKRITVRSKPLEIVDDLCDNLGTVVTKVRIATKRGMDVTVCSDEMVLPDSEVYFYVRLKHQWRRPDGSADYDEIVTDGEIFYTAFRTLGRGRMIFNKFIIAMIIDAIQEFVAELIK